MRKLLLVPIAALVLPAIGNAANPSEEFRQTAMEMVNLVETNRKPGFQLSEQTIDVDMKTASAKLKRPFGRCFNLKSKIINKFGHPDYNTRLVKYTATFQGKTKNKVYLGVQKRWVDGTRQPGEPKNGFFIMFGTLEDAGAGKVKIKMYHAPRQIAKYSSVYQWAQGKQAQCSVNSKKY